MHVTSKSRYALKIMMDLAYHWHQPKVSRRDIVQRQGIPSPYFDQIMMRLRQGGLVASLRGRTGGYRLNLPPEQINLWQIFNAAEGDLLTPVSCLSHESSCDFDVACAAHDVWKKIFMTIQHQLKEMNLAQIVNEGMHQHHLCPLTGVRECKGPLMTTSHQVS